MCEQTKTSPTRSGLKHLVKMNEYMDRRTSFHVLFLYPEKNKTVVYFDYVVFSTFQIQLQMRSAYSSLVFCILSCSSELTQSSGTISLDSVLTAAQLILSTPEHEVVSAMSFQIPETCWLPLLSLLTHLSQAL